MQLFAAASSWDWASWLGFLTFRTLDGVIFGLLPLIVGIWGQARIAYVGFALCIVAALVGGYVASAIVAIAVTALMLVVRFRERGADSDAQPPPVG